MSLKAKLEAVVYAAEEPVTLSQLAAIFAEEVLPAMDAAAHEPEAEPTPEEAVVQESLLPEATEPEAAEPVVAEAEPEAAEPAPNEDDEKKSARLRDRRVRQLLQRALDELIADYANGNRGLEIREVAGGFRLGTKAEYHDAVRGFVKSLKPPLKLSLQALETLAVVAYKQPVTAPEVSEIRGVDSAGVLGSLLTRKLVTTAGRKQVIGRPILYKTTKDFLLRFGLKDINELPSIEEFEKMAGELNETLLDQTSEPESQEQVPTHADAASHSTFSEASSDEGSADPVELETFDDVSADPIELEGHNLQPLEPDAPTSEPESIPEAESPSDLEPFADAHSPQADGDPEDEAPEDSEA